jgi:hypothetical protein
MIKVFHLLEGEPIFMIRTIKNKQSHLQYVIHSIRRITYGKLLDPLMHNLRKYQSNLVWYYIYHPHFIGETTEVQKQLATQYVVLELWRHCPVPTVL